jgi:hypothetical protein
MKTRPWMHLVMAAALALTACGEPDDSGAPQDSGEGIAGMSDACDLARRHGACDECYSGEVTCEYGEFSETAGSCGDCQARSALYGALCDAGVEDAAADIEAGTTCSDPVQ